MATRAVKDIKNGFKGAHKAMLIGLLPPALMYLLMPKVPEIVMLIVIVVPMLLCAIRGFIVNFTPLKIKDGIIYIPAVDQIRTFSDIVTLNPITGLLRRRKYNISDIEQVANGYVHAGKGKRSWDVVITGVANGTSFSQQINVSNKQVRDEVGNALKQAMRGH